MVVDVDSWGRAEAFYDYRRTLLFCATVHVGVGVGRFVKKIAQKQLPGTKDEREVE